MTSPFDGSGQLALFRFGQASLFTGFNLTVLVDVALEGFEILVIEVGYVSLVLEYFCHYLSFLKWYVVEIDRLITDILYYDVLVITFLSRFLGWASRLIT